MGATSSHVLGYCWDPASVDPDWVLLRVHQDNVTDWSPHRVLARWLVDSLPGAIAPKLTNGCPHSRPSTWAEDKRQVLLTHLGSDDARPTEPQTQDQGRRRAVPNRSLWVPRWPLFGRSTRPASFAPDWERTYVNSGSTRRTQPYPTVHDVHDAHEHTRTYQNLSDRMKIVNIPANLIFVALPCL